MSSPDLVAFLRARLSEHEDTARRMVGCLRPGTDAHFMLADVESKRRIIDLHQPANSDGPTPSNRSIPAPQGDLPHFWGPTTIERR